MNSCAMLPFVRLHLLSLQRSTARSSGRESLHLFLCSQLHVINQLHSLRTFVVHSAARSSGREFLTLVLVLRILCSTVNSAAYTVTS